MSDKTTPEAHEVEAAIKTELESNPKAGRKSIHQAIKKKNSGWAVSEKRVKKMLAVIRAAKGAVAKA